MESLFGVYLETKKHFGTRKISEWTDKSGWKDYYKCSNSFFSLVEIKKLNKKYSSGLVLQVWEEVYKLSIL